ncbi:hypothetical protein Acid345_3610 [Candidatus Koribacter versatilis Ellin345]|uniref:Uncharacterized protein n=1 Tax=Koribacter versatilis (strain Ellin345) TaxID=204669 RepID=Q1IKI9_KORVE|nr:hypothetical protein [Candidatus Koribacter versatilis]ABF42611.1 hypothetical protein Acid345_3610 [Candidatus Koribacter versatilis Ellin345]
MRRLLLFVLCSSFVLAQTPQTPRQALLEMIKATSADQIDKHTPEVMLAEMAKLPPNVREMQRRQMMVPSMIMAINPGFLQLFDSGPTLAIIDDKKDATKVEITVERDDLTGDLDSMEFGIKYTKNGKEEALPFTPRLLVDMKLEKGTWRLAKIGGSASLQLDDPAVAVLLAKQMQDQAKRAAEITGTSGGAAAPRTTSEFNVVSSLRTLVTAEVTYAASYPSTGYTCKLSDLGGSLSGKAADESGAQLINPALEAGTRYSYKFELSGCQGTKSFHAVATPMQKGVGHRTYCADESGVVKSANEGTDCFAGGNPLN